MTTDLSGHLALITGATGAIGHATCLALAALHCSVAVHYNSDSTTASTLVTKLRSLGVRADSFQADLSQYDEVRRLYKSVTTVLGDPDILFNNHGVIVGKSGAQSISEVSIEAFEESWRTNCGSTYLLAQLCMPAMEAKAWGRVIFNSSVAAFTGGGAGPHYASSKSAMHGLIHWLSARYAMKGISVNGIAPALIEDAKMLKGSDPAELSKRIPIGRMGKPEEVAETIVWMCKAGYVTNKVIGIDGGVYAY